MAFGSGVLLVVVVYFLFFALRFIIRIVVSFCVPICITIFVIICGVWIWCFIGYCGIFCIFVIMVYYSVCGTTALTVFISIIVCLGFLRCSIIPTVVITFLETFSVTSFVIRGAAGSGSSFCGIFLIAIFFVFLSGIKTVILPGLRSIFVILGIFRYSIIPTVVITFLETFSVTSFVIRGEAGSGSSFCGIFLIAIFFVFLSGIKTVILPGLRSIFVILGIFVDTRAGRIV